MTVSILGCGWYGQALAKSLTGKGIAVKGSTTSPQKLAALEADGIPAHLVNIASWVDSIVDPNFFLCDVLVMANNVKITDEDAYLEKINTTMALIKYYEIKRVIFISSTSVYGETNSTVDETTTPVPETTSGKALLKAEQLLQQETAFTSTIIRFGGLLGPGRDPGRFFAGKTNIPNGQAPVNLIHLDDCIGITEKIIQADLGNLTINAVAPHHPAKSEFYIAAAQKSDLDIPQFIVELKQWKIVNSVYADALLHYQFKIDNWLD
jgi:nucleoside-diphosphate-sugar epimerase